jgi:RHS repeat-associated protein
LKCGYIYGLERISQHRNGGVHYYVADGQGSIRALTDTSGTITDTYFYTAFGEELAKTGTTENEFRYVGEQWDPNAGFYYLRARWYDQSTGRFASVDPYAGDPQAPVSLHRYLYGSASPVVFVDPSGKFFTIGEIMMAGAIVGALYTSTHYWMTTPAKDFSFNEQLNETVEGAFLGASLGMFGYVFYAYAANLQNYVANFRSWFSTIQGGSRRINSVNGSLNCAGCTIAGDATLKGYPASALKHGPVYTNQVATFFSRNWQKGNTSSSIIEKMTQSGPGSTGVVFGYRGPKQLGHFFNVVNNDGCIRFLDFQKNPSSVMIESEVNGFEDLWFINTSF